VSWTVRTLAMGTSYLRASMPGRSLDSCGSHVSSSSSGLYSVSKQSATNFHVVYLEALRDLSQTGRYAWGVAALVHIYVQLNDASISSSRQLGGYITLLQVTNMFFIC